MNKVADKLKADKTNLERNLAEARAQISVNDSIRYWQAKAHEKD